MSISSVAPPLLKVVPPTDILSVFPAGSKFITTSLVGDVKLAAYYRGNDLRKPTGGVKGRVAKVKRKALCGGPPRAPRVGPRELENEKVTGGRVKVRLRRIDFANVYNPKEKKFVKAKILAVVSTPANPDFAKRDQIVKGAIIQTEAGRALVTSRPGQDGVVNAVLIE